MKRLWEWLWRRVVGGAVRCGIEAWERENDTAAYMASLSAAERPRIMRALRERETR